MGLLEWVRERFRKPPSAMVSVDESGVHCVRSNGLKESVCWEDLQEVYILTTENGPAMDDVFWVLAGGTSGCVVPSEALGAANLLERLQQLPGFDNRAVIEAMGSTEIKRFVCWRRDGC